MLYLFALVWLATWITRISATPFESATLVDRSLPPYNSNAPKRGLPFTNVKWTTNFDASGSKVSWAYNWMSVMDPSFPSYLEFVPMLRDNTTGRTKTWTTNANAAIAKGTTHLLAFNEPDNCGYGGACMTAQSAVDAYKKFIQPFAGKAYLGAPAVSNGAGGLPWLKQFLELCTGCHIDFVPIHWYSTATNEAYFKSYMAEARTAGANRRIWLTEFNGSGTEAQQEIMLKDLMPWMDSQTYIERYAWLWCDPTAQYPIVDSSNNPTKLGKVYETYST